MCDRRMRGNGEFTVFTGFFPAGTHPDMAVLNDFFFNDNRDYWQDPMIRKAMDDGDNEFDDAKRTALYTPILDKVNKEAYILPCKIASNIDPIPKASLRIDLVVKDYDLGGRVTRPIATSLKMTIPLLYQ